MGQRVIVTGAEFDGRAKVIRRRCNEGQQVILRRDYSNAYELYAVAVYLQVKGIFGTSLKQIGYIKSDTLKSVALRIEEGEHISAVIKSFDVPSKREIPKLTLELSI